MCRYQAECSGARTAYRSHLTAVQLSWQAPPLHTHTTSLQAHMYKQGPETLALVCGPPPMVERAVLPALKELGFDEEHTVVF